MRTTEASAKVARKRGYATSSSPSGIDVRRRAALLLSTMGLAVLLVGGVAYALDIQCQPGSNTAGKECRGTDARDTMTGTEVNDDIRGMAATTSSTASAGSTPSKATIRR